MLEPNKWEVIAGRYRLTRELARGGMGSVWAGQDKKLRRNVAVKLVAPTWDGASEAREQFEREAMAVAQLQSPHVVQIYDFGVEQQCPYIVMELLEGEDLRTRLHQVKRVTLETAAQILVQTAKALSVAHAVGIIHRDLKPGNIFLVRANEEELVKVLDFGVAKQVQTEDLLKAERGTEAVMGTPQFMSPEQARGLANIDHRTDLWALGVIVYRALTGHLPFHAPTPTEVIVKVCTEDPRKVSELAPDLPAELDEFFARALARDPNQRFETARQMTLAFSRISPVTFTTLSMPDPDPAIEEAIRLARAAAGTDVLDDDDDDDDDDAATVAFDGQAAKKLAEDIDDAESAPKPVEPVPGTLRGQGAPLPAPIPPPSRRSHPGPPPVRRPPPQVPPPPGGRVPPTAPFQRVHSAPPIQPVGVPPPGHPIHSPPPIRRAAKPPPPPPGQVSSPGRPAPPPLPARASASAAPELAAPPAAAVPDSTPTSGVVPTPAFQAPVEPDTPTPAAGEVPEPVPSADALTPLAGAALPPPVSAPIPLGGGLPSLMDDDDWADDTGSSEPSLASQPSQPSPVAPLEHSYTTPGGESEEQRSSGVPVLAEPPEESRSTLLMAIGAVIVGVLIAVAGSIMIKGSGDDPETAAPVANDNPTGVAKPPDGPPNKADAPRSNDQAATDPGEQAESDQGEDAVADKGADEPRPDDGETKAKAVAKGTAAPPETPAKTASPPAPDKPAEPPPPKTAKPPPPKPPPPEPPPPKTPPKTDDPFADRL